MPRRAGVTSASVGGCPPRGYRAAVATCTSCGRDGEETERVHRVYLVLPEGATADAAALEDVAEATVLDEVEDWCATCRDQFPHVAARPD